jgi:hypothetical protein
MAAYDSLHSDLILSLSLPLSLLLISWSQSHLLLYSVGADSIENTLPSNGRLLLSRIVEGFTKKRAVHPESVSAGRCLSSRCLAMGLYVTIHYFSMKQKQVSQPKMVASLLRN